jgi:hypothetical protein
MAQETLEKADQFCESFTKLKKALPEKGKKSVYGDNGAHGNTNATCALVLIVRRQALETA